MAGTVSVDVRDILNLDEDFPATYSDQANVEAIIGQDAKVNQSFESSLLLFVKIEFVSLLNFKGLKDAFVGFYSFYQGSENWF